MSLTATSSQVVTFRGGFTASLDVVLRLLDLERRGARFEPVQDGGFRVISAVALVRRGRCVPTVSPSRGQSHRAVSG